MKKAYECENKPENVVQNFYIWFAGFNLSLGRLREPTDGFGWLSLKYRKPDSNVLDKF